MKATRSKTKITFTGISNESQLEDVTVTADNTKCTYEQSDFSTKVVVKGTPKQLEAFVKKYNS